MKPLIKIGINFFLLGYFAVSLLTLPDCRNKSNSSAGDTLQSKKEHSLKVLVGKFDAEQFDIHSTKLLNHPVVLDTLMISMVNKNGASFLKAEIRCEGDKKYFAELKCGKEIADYYRKTKTNRALIAAQINRIDDCPVTAEADSLDGRNGNYNLGKSVLLSGECLEIVEIR